MLNIWFDFQLDELNYLRENVLCSQNKCVAIDKSINEKVDIKVFRVTMRASITEIVVFAIQ